MNILDEMTKTNWSLLETKQIINKIIASYKIKKEWAFDDNVVVTRSEIWPELDYEQFRSVNSKKLETSLSGYTPNTQEYISFECKHERINGVFVTFNVRDSFVNEDSITYMSQYQFVADGKWYIIWFASINEKTRDKSDKRLTDLSCDPPEEEE